MKCTNMSTSIHRIGYLIMLNRALKNSTVSFVLPLDTKSTHLLSFKNFLSFSIDFESPKIDYTLPHNAETLKSFVTSYRLLELLQLRPFDFSPCKTLNRLKSAEFKAFGYYI